MNRRTCLLVALLWFAPVAWAAEDKFFDSNGVKIHFIEEGEGEPVILIHGFTANIGAQWGGSGVLRALKDDFHVIALDNRGHGRSDKPHDPAKYGQEMVDDVPRLMKHLGIDKAHLVGYSMGGFITNKLISQHPELAISATLGGAGWRRPTDERFDFLDELATSLEEGKGITPLIERLTPPGRPKPTAEQLRTMNQMVLLMNDPKALAAVARGMAALSIPEDAIKANHVPVLALIGDQDPIKESVDALVGVMPDLKVIEIKDADHMTAFSRPEFIDGLKDFLNAHRLQPVEAAGVGQ